MLYVPQLHLALPEPGGLAPRQFHLLESPLPTLKAKLALIPEGAGVLFFVQIFATLGFAVLYSTLVLYTTRHLHFLARDAAVLMGVFGAFNYGLHLFGGYLGGRFLSNRNLFVGSMMLQVIGCAMLSTGTLEALYIGLALFLTGSGLNVTCIPARGDGPGAGRRLPLHRHAPDQEGGVFPSDGPDRRGHPGPALRQCA